MTLTAILLRRQAITYSRMLAPFRLGMRMSTSSTARVRQQLMQVAERAEHTHVAQVMAVLARMIVEDADDFVGLAQVFAQGLQQGARRQARRRG